MASNTSNSSDISNVTSSENNKFAPREMIDEHEKAEPIQRTKGKRSKGIRLCFKRNKIRYVEIDQMNWRLNVVVSTCVDTTLAKTY